MSKINKKFDLEHYFFRDTSFDNLMQRRIQNVLLICSTYDSFILEEDGRINETIFQEYVALNLRYPPVFHKAHSADEAFQLLDKGNMDLVINMLSITDSDSFMLSREIKKRFLHIPIVVLTPFSKEVSSKLENEDLNVIDYVFSWLGNPRILVVIIKLIEDKMNTHYDVRQVGVQCILLVEDSIRYYSSYLPNMYSIIFEQSREFMTEGLNEHQMMLRMRGRPKILLATNFEQAISLYEMYKTQMLGIISDVTFKKGGTKDQYAGIKLAQIVKSNDPYLPFLLQSSDLSNERFAKEIKVKFLHKYSSSLLLEMKDFIRDYLAFGDFKVIDPVKKIEINSAHNLQALQEIIYDIPDNSLRYHIQRNHFSKWLRARALFSLANLFRKANSRDFENPDEAREFLFTAISRYRADKGRGVIAQFNKEKYNEYIIFSRLGEGNLGGKGRGLAFIDNIIKRHTLMNKYQGVNITIPKTVVLSTDLFDDFMRQNDLYQTGLGCKSDEEILNAFLAAQLPDSVFEDLKAILSVITKPIAVRSSSLLEDSHYQPFAGIYSTYMIPNTGTEKERITALAKAIKSVYASVYYKDSKAYMTATSNVIDEEKMAVVLQEICGKSESDLYFPTLSGVARSINFYPIAPEKAEDGIVNIAYGLGKYIVDGGVSLRFSPKYPEKIIQLSSTNMVMKDTQKYFYALNLKNIKFTPHVDDGENIDKLKIRDAQNFSSFKHIASTYDYNNDRVVDGIQEGGLKVVTFSRILKHKSFPLAEIIANVLEIGAKEMGKPVEIEFAVNINKGDKDSIFSLLQIRPIVDNKENIHIIEDQIKEESCLIISKMALGNGLIENIRDIVYVNPDTFDASKTTEIAQQIEKLNAEFIAKERPYILIGPGRWGSSDPWLGIPVKWSQISGAKVIVEAGLENFHIEPSQGTHFFQNLTSFRVSYLTINPHIGQGFYDYNYLNNKEALFDNGMLRHVKLLRPVSIAVDGKKSVGIISRENIKIDSMLDLN
ncbi:MAG: phosphoenolpyruvate synthase [Bacteroidales bacterium]|nr:phosphoenolpyruvate synthase [Bacteroidales bacterium]